MEQHLRSHIKGGFTLTELSTVILILGVMAVAALATISPRITAAKGKKTVVVMEQLAEKTVQYYKENNKVWPADLTLLQPNYLPAGFDFTNPFGQSYLIVSATPAGVVIGSLVKTGAVDVNTGEGISITPSSITGFDQINVFQAAGLSIDLKNDYEAKHFYQ